MNPFTRFLRSQRRTTPADLEVFIERWDRLESLIINVYRRGSVDAETEAVYADLRAWLAEHYRDWAVSLEPFWRASREGGAPPPSDPFARLLAPTSARWFIHNRPAMQALPAAREALNRYLLSL
ncbi:MAG: hypothetical protein KIT87_26135 [Anaerolineae bacterium]|nr:hypothetical protein [Anaerolineae bacterium]